MDRPLIIDKTLEKVNIRRGGLQQSALGLQIVLILDNGQAVFVTLDAGARPRDFVIAEACGPKDSITFAEIFVHKLDKDVQIIDEVAVVLPPQGDEESAIADRMASVSLTDAARGPKVVGKRTVYKSMYQKEICVKEWTPADEYDELLIYLFELRAIYWACGLSSGTWKIVKNDACSVAWICGLVIGFHYKCQSRHCRRRVLLPMMITGPILREQGVYMDKTGRPVPTNVVLSDEECKKEDIILCKKCVNK
jgi:hypothetical protein